MSVTSVQNDPLPSPVSLPTVGAKGNAAVGATPALGLHILVMHVNHLIIFTIDLLTLVRQV